MHQDTVTWETNISLSPKIFGAEFIHAHSSKKDRSLDLEENKHAHLITFPARITFTVWKHSLYALSLGVPPPFSQQPLT